MSFLGILISGWTIPCRDLKENPQISRRLSLSKITTNVPLVKTKCKFKHYKFGLAELSRNWKMLIVFQVSGTLFKVPIGKCNTFQKEYITKKGYQSTWRSNPYRSNNTLLKSYFSFQDLGTNWLSVAYARLYLRCEMNIFFWITHKNLDSSFMTFNIPSTVAIWVTTTDVDVTGKFSPTFPFPIQKVWKCLVVSSSVASPWPDV